MDLSMKLWKKIIYSSLLRELDTTKGDGGWCIVPPLSVLYKYSHAYKRSWLREPCDRPCCVTEQMRVRPIIVVSTMTMTTKRMTLCSCQSCRTAGTSRPWLVTEPSGWNSLDGNHVHKSKNFYFVKDNELTSMTILFEATDLHFIYVEDRDL